MPDITPGDRLAAYFWQLPHPQREAYAKRVDPDSNRHSLRNHYFARGGDGTPRPKVIPALTRIVALADESQGRVSRHDAVDYFLAHLPARSAA